VTALLKRIPETDQYDNGHDMKRFFIQITNANMLLLLIVTVWGHFADARSAFPVLVGFTAVFTALIHSVIYTYFIATGKFVERAIDEHGYGDQSALGRVKKNKMQSFRYGFFAIVFTMGAAFFYFWSSPVRQDMAIWRGWAAISSYLAILMNLYAAKIEWKYICANCVITDDILKTMIENEAVIPSGDGV